LFVTSTNADILAEYSVDADTVAIFKKVRRGGKKSVILKPGLSFYIRTYEKLILKNEFFTKKSFFFTYEHTKIHFSRKIHFSYTRTGPKTVRYNIRDYFGFAF
jgi:hypothetical protein